MLLAGHRAHRGGRHRQARLVVGQLDAGHGVLAGTETLAGVVQRQRHADGTGAGLGGRRDAGDAGGHRLIAALHLHLHRHAWRELAHLVRADQAGELQLGQVDDGQHLLLRGDLLAGQRVPLGDDAVDRRDQRGLAQQHLAGAELRLRGQHLAARRLELRAGVVQRRRRDEVLRSQALVGLVLALGLLVHGAGRFDAGIALGHLVTQFLQVQLPQRLAGLDPAALAHRQAVQAARGLGADDHGIGRDQRAGELDQARHRRHRRLDDLARLELQGRLGRVLLRRRSAAPARGVHAGAARQDGHRHATQPPLLAHDLPHPSTRDHRFDDP